MRIYDASKSRLLAIIRLQYTCSRNSGQQRDVQEALHISRSVFAVLLPGGATRTAASSYRINYGFRERPRVAISRSLHPVLSASPKWVLVVVEGEWRAGRGGWVAGRAGGEGAGEWGGPFGMTVYGQLIKCSDGTET